MQLEGKNAVLAGGTSGIGLATAVRLAEAGASVAVFSSTPEAGRRVAEASAATGQEIRFYRSDIAVQEDVENVVRRIIDDLGDIDILVNAAALLEFGNATEISVENWNRTLAVNLTGAFLSSRAVLPSMSRRGGGSIVNIASIYATMGAARRIAYCTTKAGLLGLTRAMAIDHGPDGIRVNAICPGSVDTDLLRKAWQTVAMGRSEAEMRQTAVDAIPLGDIAEPRDIANLVLFLCADEGRYITGASFPIDGGLSVKVGMSQAR